MVLTPAGARLISAKFLLLIIAHYVVTVGLVSTATYFVTVLDRFALFDEARVEVISHVELQSHS